MNQPSLAVPLGLALLGALGPLATTPRCQLPDGAALMDEMEEVTYRDKTIDSIESLQMRGKCVFRLVAPGSEQTTKGTFAEYYQGEKVFSVSDFKGFGKTEEGTDGEVTWVIDPMSGAMIRQGEDAAVMQRIWGLTRGDPWRQHYPRARCTEGKPVSGRDCWVVVLEPESGDPMTVYVDQKSKLMAGVDVTMPTPGGRDEVQVRITKWQTVDGIRYAAATGIKTKYVAIDYTYDEIVHNAEIPASRFELPPAIAKLRDREPSAEGAAAGGVEVSFREVPERHVASVRVKVKPEHIGQTLAQILPEVMAYLTEAGAAPAAPPFTRYHSFGADEIDLEAGFPVPEPIEGKGRVAPSVLPGGKVAEAWHYGDYHKLSTTWTQVEAWLKKQPGIELGGARWEVYWTDPGREPDVSKWRTQLFWSVR